MSGTANLLTLPIADFHYDEREMSLPTQGIISITNRCNLACPYCFHNQSPVDMDFDTADKAIRFLLANAAQRQAKAGVTFFGGEPLLCFDSIIKPLVLKYGDILGWSITTNGMLLTKEVVDFCFDHKISILLSLDGGKIIQDAQRPTQDGTSSFDMIAKNIPYLLYRSPDTILRATVTRFSLNHLDEITHTAERYGFKYIRLVPNLYETWDDTDYEKITRFMDLEAIKLMQSISWGEKPNYILTNLSIGVTELYYQNKEEALFNPLERCGMGRYGIGISPEGFLHPCQEANGKHNKDAIGDIFNGIDPIAHEAYFRRIYDKWLEYIQQVNKLILTPSFKLFYANAYCSTRIDEQVAFGSTQLHFLRATHHACSRLYRNYHLTLNPFARQIFSVV